MIESAKVLPFPPREQQQEVPVARGLQAWAAEVKVAEPPPKGAQHRRFQCPVLQDLWAYVTSTGLRKYYVRVYRKGEKYQTTIVVGDLFRDRVEKAKSNAMKVIAAAHAGTYVSKREAKREQVRVAVAKALAAPGDLTFKQAAEIYLKAKQRSATTLKQYRRSLEKLAAWHARALWQISKAEVKAMFEKLQETYEATTVSNVFKFFGYVWVHNDLVSDVSRPSPTMVLRDMWAKLGSRQAIIERADFALWWASLDTFGGQCAPAEHIATAATWAMYFRCLVLTGARRTEMRKAKWSDINLKRRVWTFTAEITKTGVALELPIGKRFADLLEAYRQTQSHNDGYVFAAANGRCLTDSMSLQFKRHIEAHGIPWSCHTLRHTFLTIATALKIPQEVRMSLVNHKPTSVHTKYIHPELEVRRDAMAKIEAEIFGRVRPKLRLVK